MPGDLHECRIALEASWKEAQTAADRAEERASASATELTKCYQIIEKLQVSNSVPPLWFDYSAPTQPVWDKRI